MKENTPHIERWDGAGERLIRIIEPTLLYIMCLRSLQISYQELEMVINSEKKSFLMDKN